MIRLFNRRERALRGINSANKFSIPRKAFSRKAFSIVEASIAAVLCGVVAVGIITALRDSSIRTSNAVARQMALTIAKGEIQRIRAAGPVAYNTNADTFRVTSQGIRDTTGTYRVNILRTASCTGGRQSGDQRSLLTGECGDTIVPVYSYHVAVQYAERRLGSASAMTTAQGINLNMTFGPSTVAQSACTAPQVWLGSTCGCPGTMVYNGAYNSCDCPAGTSLSYGKCVASSCAASQYQTRSDCIGGQTGSSTWRKDPDPTTCVYSPWTQVSRTCSCPVNTTWNGVACAANAGSCPSGTVWDGSSCVCNDINITMPSDTTVTVSQTHTFSMRAKFSETCSSSSPWTGKGGFDAAGTWNPYASAGAQSTVPGMTMQYGLGDVAPGYVTGTFSVTDARGQGQTKTYHITVICDGPATQDSTASCPANYSGTNTYRKTQNPATCAYGAYSLYSTSCTCSAPAANTRVDACPANYAGPGINMKQDSTSCGAYGAWYETGRSCSCSAAAYTTSTGACPSGYSGSISYRADSTSCGVYGAPYQTGSTCVCATPPAQTGSGGYDSTYAGGDMNWSPQGSERCTRHISYVDSTNSCTNAVTRSYSVGSESCVPKFTLGWGAFAQDSVTYAISYSPISRVVTNLNGSLLALSGSGGAQAASVVAYDSAGNSKGTSLPSECRAWITTSDATKSYVDTSSMQWNIAKVLYSDTVYADTVGNKGQFNDYNISTNIPFTTSIQAGCQGMPAAVTPALTATAVCSPMDDFLGNNFTYKTRARLDRFITCDMYQRDGYIRNHCSQTSMPYDGMPAFMNCAIDSSAYVPNGAVTYQERDTVVFHQTYTTGSGAGGWVNYDLTVTYFYSDMYDNGVRVASSYFGQQKLEVATAQGGAWSTRDSSYSLANYPANGGSTNPTNPDGSICRHVRPAAACTTPSTWQGCQGINTVCGMNKYSGG